MTITPDEYRGKVNDAFQPEVLKGFMLGVATAYRTAPEHCKRQYEEPDRHDMIGCVRRARIQEAIRGVAERYQLAYKDEPNTNGSHYFLSVLSGEIRLVCNLVATRRTMVRPAKIRKLWARYNFSAQTQLFSDGDGVPEGWRHLAVLVHSPMGRHRDEAGFVDIVVPNRTFSEYLVRFDLFKLFPAETEQYRKLFRRRRARSEAEGA
jgi:hypothetical protein